MTSVLLFLSPAQLLVERQSSICEAAEVPLVGSNLAHIYRIFICLPRDPVADLLLLVLTIFQAPLYQAELTQDFLN